ncbi:hypothetical protein HDU85_002260 [Gaertneriomyces sp. JEL0708]|nr:hypothetical protein HDU85_002260 [Gaertneriomyces sp. JEL0708]
MLSDSNGAVDSKDRILVIGCEGVGKRALVTGLLLRNSHSDDADKTMSASLPACVPYKIDTKYYSAELCLWIDSVPQETPLVEKDMRSWCDIAGAVDAFIFVYDVHKPESFEAIKPWKTFLEAASPNIAICVANVLEASTRPSAEFSALQDTHESWCIQNELEYVDMTMVSESDGDTAAIEGDSFGIDRIKEALENNMWKHMRRKGAAGAAAETPSEGLPSLSDIERARDLIFGKFLAAEDDLQLHDDDDMDMEHAISSLQNLRAIGQTLSDTDRRTLAARIALSLDVDSSDDDEL